MKKYYISLLLIPIFIGAVFIYFDYKKRSSVCPIVGSKLELGQVNFDVATQSTLAQQHFQLGLRYLHNFMYPLALREFSMAKKIDPLFALSYWGIAMSYHWPLWSYLDKAKGLKNLYEYDDVKNMAHGSALEKDLVSAISIIYGEGSVLDNDKKYISAMENLYQRYPKNVDVASFYALALLGHQSDAPFDPLSERYVQKAREVLQPFIATYPNHPGVLHYFMHATDTSNTEIAREGLKVTDSVLAHIIDSSHVLHMPSHLYTELGLWQQAIKANQQSIAASHRICTFLQKQNIHLDMPLSMCSPLQKPKAWTEKKWFECDADNLYHSTEWLHYEYLQLGQFDKAAEVIQNMQKVVDTTQQSTYLFWLYRLHARQIIFSEEWLPLQKLPAPITQRNGDIYWAAYSECGLLLADGLRAIFNHQTKYLPMIEKRFNRILKLMKNKEEGGFRSACELMRNEFLAAKLFYIDKNIPKSLQQLKKTLVFQAKHPLAQLSFTLPFIPVQEFYANLLVAASKPIYLQEAIQLYRNVLNNYPNRSQARLGLARAQMKLGHTLAAKKEYQKLAKQFVTRDVSPILQEVQRFS